MTLSDLNPEVIAFFEVEHLGPDWSLCQIRDQVFDLTSNRPIWPISDINASHIYLLLKNTFCTVRTLPIPVDSGSTVKEPHGMTFDHRFSCIATLRMNEVHSTHGGTKIQIFHSLLLVWLSVHFISSVCCCSFFISLCYRLVK